MSLQTIGFFRLLNEGGFIAKMRFNYIDDDGRNKGTLQTGDIFPGQTTTAKLADFGVPDGALVYLQVDVVWDGQNKADDAFAHDKDSDGIACYAIAGTTASNTLSLTGLERLSAGGQNTGSFQ